MIKLTELGKFLRIFRIEKGLSLREMAHCVGVSASMLSAVETGKKNAPISLIDNIYDYMCKYKYSIDYRDFTCIARFSMDRVVIKLRDLTSENASLSVDFAGKIKELDEESLREISEILDRVEK